MGELTSWAWPGRCARLLACWPRQRHDWRAPLCAQVPDITLPPTTAEPARRDGRTPATPPGPGIAAPCVLIPPTPGHEHSGVTG